MEYTVGLKLRPDIAAAQYNRAQCLITLERKAEAVAGLERAVQLDPAFTMAYHSLGEQLATIPMGTPEVLFGAFIAWHAFKLGVLLTEAGGRVDTGGPSMNSLAWHWHCVTRTNSGTRHSFFASRGRRWSTDLWAASCAGTSRTCRTISSG